jgi:hypothetical protein
MNVAGLDGSPSQDAPPWLPLLRRLTEVSELWGVWKNADRAIAGHGDIDSISAPLERAIITVEFQRWASENGLLPVVACTHLPGSYLLVAVGRAPSLIELQLCETALWRAAPLFGAAELRALMTMDERGFRRIRRGSEGLMLLVHNGLRRGGGVDRSALHKKGIVQMLTDDPEGVAMAADIFSPISADVLRLARTAAAGGWDRSLATRLELWALGRAASHPGQAVARVAYRLGRSCPVTAALSRGRRIAEEPDEWLTRVGATHETFWQDVD